MKKVFFFIFFIFKMITALPENYEVVRQLIRSGFIKNGFYVFGIVILLTAFVKIAKKGTNESRLRTASEMDFCSTPSANNNEAQTIALERDAFRDELEKIVGRTYLFVKRNGDYGVEYPRETNSQDPMIILCASILIAIVLAYFFI